MDLGTAHDNTVRAALYYAQIIIGMLLSLRPKATIALHVTLCNSHTVIAISAQLIVFLHSLFVFQLSSLGHFFRNDVQGKQGIRPDLFNENDKRRTFAGTCRNELTPFE